MALLLDTGVILAAMLRRERRHSWARRLLRDALSGRYGPPYVTDYIVDEALSYLAARRLEDAARRLLDAFMHRSLFRIVPVTLDVFTRAARIYEEHLPRLSFTDATSLAAAQAYKIDYIATLDVYLASLYPSLTPPGG